MSETPAHEHEGAPAASPALSSADSPVPVAAPIPESPAPELPTAHPSADPRVDDALSRLAEVEDLPLPEQVAVYADIHRRLAGVLSDPDSQA